MVIVIATITGLSASAYLLYFVADDTLRVGEQSAVAADFVDDFRDDPDVDLPLTKPVFPATFGQEGGKHTLVVYDTESAEADLYALGTANLATHFGQSTMLQVSDYQPGQMHDYDAAVYVGTRFGQELPHFLIQDMLDRRTKILWVGANIENLSNYEGSPEAEAFGARYGWLPSSTEVNEKDAITKIVYKDEELERSEFGGSIHVPAIIDPEKVEVLGTAVCGTRSTPRECRGTSGTEFPWAVRTGHLTYVTDIPLDVIYENTHHLAYADLFYDLLAPGTVPTKKAAVRFEDVGPEADPRVLRRVADYLHERGIPFQVAVVPFHVSEVPDSDPVRHYGLSLLDRPKVVKALKYMQERGGTLIQHGTSHQYGTTHNPYPGATSGADYEFYRSRCSDNQFPPLQFEECRQESWVQLTGPVSWDKVEDHAERLAAGRKIMVDAGLGEPDQFEVPHYSASPNAYQAISEYYDYRYERVHYFPGLTSGVEFEEDSDFTQIFPYRVHDVYGTTVLPENLGNVSEEMQNNHPPRPPAFLVDNAKRNLVVRESTASFFFHPYLDVDYLDEVVTGITDLGYTFVPSTEL
ncbi:DUF2334 domain-containing protein [Corynebacterium sp. YIM 101645]|uniref:DUF2334 domain-containing protein n=1 Tax=Corynebacterium lemuris TaxID=1859292 RepID=A0ABT2FWU1_9CORY|nr:DUF2334 domain-containing protein [Corynebacterium lemuris]MCS5479270.1 DUF2334 domain-containing protein [Corynebacterium lemuris]